MEDLLGLIIPLLAVAGWLFGMFKTEENDSDSQNRRPNRNEPAPKPARPDHRQRQEIEKPAPKEVDTVERGANEYYEKKKKQIDSLKNQVESATSTTISKAEITMGENRPSVDERQADRPDEEVYFEKGKDVISVKRNLTKQGLAKSIVMAEVLGSPRAIKPYRSIIAERRK